jgi:hypothetical protein
VPPAPEPDAAEPEVDGSPEETPGGLPIRRPQESLAPALRTDEPLVTEDPDVPELRDPEEVKRIMGAYQRGTRGGRAAGEQNAAAGPGTGTGPETDD